MPRKKTYRKIHLKEQVTSVGCHDLEISLDRVIETFQMMKDEAEKRGFRELNVSYEYEENWSGSVLVLTGKRVETDKEFNSRVVREERAAEKKRAEKREKEAAERKEYARLQKKFEKGA